VRLGLLRRRHAGVQRSLGWLPHRGCLRHVAVAVRLPLAGAGEPVGSCGGRSAPPVPTPARDRQDSPGSVQT
jgi:hypothetical protein